MAGHSGYSMKTAVIKRSIVIKEKKTSVSLEDDIRNGSLEIAAYRKIAVPALVEQLESA